VKISVETSVGGFYNAETEAWEEFPALTITRQGGRGQKRESTTFRFESSVPAEMLRAAAAFFEAAKAL
jgi:hypothetical protein